MKKTLLLAAMIVASSASHSQGYVGAMISLSRMSDACAQSLRCEGSTNAGFKIFAGSSLPAEQVLTLGSAKLGRVEVGALRFGKTTSSGQVATQVYDPVTDDFPTVLVPGRERVQADAILAAAVVDVAVLPNLNLATKLGVAYVSATAVSERNGARVDSQTKSSVQPYIGFGIEYALPYDVQLQGGVDWTRYRVDGRSGSAMQVGLGAAVSF